MGPMRPIRQLLGEYVFASGNLMMNEMNNRCVNRRRQTSEPRLH